MRTAYPHRLLAVFSIGARRVTPPPSPGVPEPLSFSAMALLSVANLELAYGDHLVLDGVNLTLELGDHVGLVGRNGCGKSTLMKLIAGLENLKPDAGHCQLARSATAGYLSQHHQLNHDLTLREEAQTAFAASAEYQRKLEDVTTKMAEAQGDELDALLAEYELIERHLEASGGYVTEHKVEETLHGVGLTDAFFDVRVADLSGGQRGRLALAKLLLSEPDVLLLDEPTNHLDIAGRQWLEEYLNAYRGAVILISHDRWMLDRCVTKIHELEGGELVEYPGNYGKFRELRAERIEGIRRAHEKQQTYIRQQQAFIDRYRAGQRSKQAQGREKRLERYKASETIELPPELDTMSLSFNPSSRAGDIVLRAEGLSKAYEGKRLFAGFDFELRRGDRVGVIGPNGAGKSTLIRCLLGEQAADAGACKLGASVSVGHFTQTHDDLHLDQTVVDYLYTVLTKAGGSAMEQSARDLAGAFLFSGDDQDKPLSVLSGGERARAVLAGLMVGGHNLLVLDEPSNHLDIPSAERLEQAIRKYTTVDQKYGDNKDIPGTLLLITHDRMLLENTVDQLIVLDGAGGVERFEGTYHEWLAKQEQNAPTQSPAPAPTRTPAQADSSAVTGRHPAPAASKPKSQGKASAPAQTPASKPAPHSRPPAPRPAKRKRNSRFGHLSQAKLETRIEQTEARLRELDQLLDDPETYRDQARFSELHAEHEKLSGELGPLEEEWASRAEAG